MIHKSGKPGHPMDMPMVKPAGGAPMVMPPVKKPTKPGRTGKTTGRRY